MIAILENLNYGQYFEYTIRLLLALLCGAVIGFERTKRFKEAGLRTHIIVCLAAALLMIVSKYGFADLVNGTDYLYGTHGADPARIAAQVISGISFLGAGIIFHNNNSVRGLTTAAGIWATAGIGLALGAGMYYLGIIVTVMVAIVQLYLYKHLIGADGLKTNQICFSVTNTEAVRKAVNEFFTSPHLEIMESRIEYDSEGYANYNITVRANRQITIEEVNDVLVKNGKVKNISVIVLKS